MRLEPESFQSFGWQSCYNNATLLPPSWRWLKLLSQIMKRELWFIDNHRSIFTLYCTNY